LLPVPRVALDNIEIAIGIGIGIGIDETFDNVKRGAVLIPIPIPIPISISIFSVE